MEGVSVGRVNMNKLFYADGTVQLAESEGSLQAILNEVPTKSANEKDIKLTIVDGNFAIPARLV